mgnify:CR=1 FL=1
MSSESHPEGLPRMRCEAVASNAPPTLDCHRPHNTLRRVRGSADDPAMLIGLALGHVRTADGLTGIVPPRVIAHLLAHVEQGDLACRLIVDWLGKRSRNAALQLKRRKVRERPRVELGRLKKRWSKTQDLSGLGSAIIAETTEGHVDE